MKKKFSVLLLAVLLCAVPVLAVVDGQALDSALKDAREQLKEDYLRRQRVQERMEANYRHQHQRMLGIIKRCNELSMSLYLQKKEYTFDLSYALEQVTSEYNDFNSKRTPYDRIVNDMDVEIDRYARLIESLRRLPPALDSADIRLFPDSLRFHNDSLESHLRMASTTLEQDMENIAKALADSSSAPFFLSTAGQQERDSCLFYASGLLKMYVDSKETIVADSTYYREAYLRLRESYDYAVERYNMLQKEIFLDGQVPVWDIIARPQFYWRIAKQAFNRHYGLSESFRGESVRDLTDKEENAVLLVAVPLLIFQLLGFWLIGILLFWLGFKFIKPLKNLGVPTLRRNMYALLFASGLLIITAGFEDTSVVSARMSFATLGTFLWLLVALVGALLVRLGQDQLKYGLRLYIPTIIMALVVISFRVSFMPNILMNIIFPPVLALILLWQLISCFANGRKADALDSVFCWLSFLFTGIAAAFAFFGYIFIALMILVWWYFQLAAIHTIAAVWHLMVIYKEKRMVRKLAAYDKKIDFVTGPDKKNLMFGATWFYDLIKGVLIPCLGLASLPLCIRYSLGIFNFNDLYKTFYTTPFFKIVNLDGVETFRFSMKSIVILVMLFFIFKYFNTAVHALWQHTQYAAFMRKNNRKTVRTNEINLSLANSIISVLVWFSYIVTVVTVLKIPTGSLSLVAGGLSAGIGLAMKDIINNFIYGIQLMSGRLRVGDWIECDGIRGRVSDINYQSTLVETINGTQVAFLNSTLFSSSFNNLTRGDSYEFLKVVVGVAYGTPVERVREVLERELQQLRTKDKFGREVVEPKYGIVVRFSEFGDSAVEIAVKQYVLVPERIAFIDREKELIYKALNDNGITIPFPQRDIHIISNE